APARARTQRSSNRTLFTCGTRDQLRDRCTRQQHQQPDADQLEPVAQASRQRQQAEHHETQAEIVRLGQCMQTRQRIGKAQQADRTGEKEERARRDGDDRHEVECQAHSSLLGSSAPRAAAPFLTKAMEAKVASSASVRATSTVAGTPVTAPTSSTAAM